MSASNIKHKFAGKTIVLTGAGSGLGRSVCRELVSAGALVHALDIDGGRLRELSEMSGLPGRVTVHEVDVADVAGMSRVIGGIIEEAGAIDFLFNNAGVTLIGESHTIAFEKNKRVLDINLLGLIHGTHLIYPQIEQPAGGHDAEIRKHLGKLENAVWIIDFEDDRVAFDPEKIRGEFRALAVATGDDALGGFAGKVHLRFLSGYLIATSNPTSKRGMRII
jgi:NAD(P)-dependent dehydrogenase (short-subunit alcohol dehydrogenase family)